MRSIFVTAWAVATALMSCSAAMAAAPDDGKIHAIEHGLTPAVEVEGRSYRPQTIEQLMAQYHVPAVSIAFVENGKVAWTRSYGLADVAAHQATTPQTLFQAGSISKPVAATGVLTLVQDGRLNLDEPVNDQLKSWKLPDNDFTRKTPVTLRMLLTHTGGVTVHGFLGYEAGKPVPTVIQVLDGAPPANSAPIRVDLAPGTQWRYSGGGLTIAQLMAIDASGESFAKLLKTRVLTPFGMSESSYDQPLTPPDLAKAAVGYRSDGKPIAGLRNTYPELAAAGLWTTPTDLCHWVIGIEDAFAGRSDAVLNQATAKAMLTPGLGGWGLGVGVETHGKEMIFTHGGANEGFRAEMYGLPDRRQGVAIMTNSDEGEKVMQPLLHAIAAQYGWPGFEVKTIKALSIAVDALKAYAGHYKAGDMDIVVRVGADHASLQALPPGGEVFELVATGPDRFTETGDAIEVTFHRDGAGKISGFDFDGVKLERSGDL